LDCSPFYLLRKSRVSLEHLGAYREIARRWVLLESKQARQILAGHKWTDKAGESITDGLALQLASSLGTRAKDDHFEVDIQMNDVLRFESLVEMEPQARLEARREHAVRTQADLLRSLELPEGSYSRLWLSNQIIASLRVEQIRRCAENEAVRRISPMLPIEGCIDQCLSRVSLGQLSSKRDGRGQIVALLDSGVDDSHPDLGSAQVIHKQDYTQRGHRDEHGHGTHLADVIASSHSLYRGVTPKATIWSYRVLDQNNTRATHKELALSLQQAVQDAVNEGKHIQQRIVINCSCAVPLRSGTWGKDFRALCDTFDQATSDAIVVVAAGNQGPVSRSITAPGGGNAVITVGASVGRPGGGPNFVAPYSSRGPAIRRRSKPDIVAPGGFKQLKGDCHNDVSVVSSRIDGVWANDQSEQKPWFVDKEHYGASGTSQATALVSGICALLLEDLATRQIPTSHPEMAQGLKETATTLGLPRTEQGAGLVQADEAMNWF
jgi:subtilisin family serine protease